MFKRMGYGVAAVLVLGGLVYNRTQAANPVTVDATEKEFQITLSTTTVPAGTPVEFDVTNLGKIQHEFVIEKAGADDQHLTAEMQGKETDAEIEAFNPGQTRSLVWTFSEPGQFQVACHLPGHFEAGMVAQFTVIAPSSINSQPGPSTTGGASLTSSSGSPIVLPEAGGVWSAGNLGLILGTFIVLIGGGIAVWKLARRRA